jgi:hypothetical protein
LNQRKKALNERLFSYSFRITSWLERQVQLEQLEQQVQLEQQQEQHHQLVLHQQLEQQLGRLEQQLVWLLLFYRKQTKQRPTSRPIGVTSSLINFL